MKNIKNTKKAKILTLSIPIMSKLEVRAEILKALSNEKCTKVYTPNAQMALGCARSKEISKIFSRAELLIPDGIGLILASRILGTPLPERITGIDTASYILRQAEKRGLSIALLGAKPRIAEMAKLSLEKRFPKLNIVYTHHGYFEKAGKENEKIITELNLASPDILFVCFGFPLQELWIDKNASRINSLRLCIGLGGTLDVLSGEVKRAPIAIQKIGLEWLWRTLGDKKRYGNFVNIIDFILLSAEQKRKKSKIKCN